jgi:8-oxo-dGTP diphosphatase
MIQVTAAVILKDYRVLVARRSPHKHMGGYWEFPGGKIEDGETPQQALARELLEELGITIRVGEYFITNEHDYGDKKISLIAYFCSWFAGSLRLADHDAVQWCSATELLELDLAPADIPIATALSASLESDYKRTQDR